MHANTIAATGKKKFAVGDICTWLTEKCPKYCLCIKFNFSHNIYIVSFEDLGKIWKLKKMRDSI